MKYEIVQVGDNWKGVIRRADDGEFVCDTPLCANQESAKLSTQRIMEWLA